MRGQWVGRFSGNADGVVIVNCDEEHGNLVVEVMLTPDTTELPRSIALFEAPGGKLPAKVLAHVAPFHPNTLRVSDWGSIRDLYDAKVMHASTADVDFNIHGLNLTIDAATDVGGVFKASLWRLPEDAESRVSGERVSWQEFKSKIAETAGGSYVYRGQQHAWPLKSSFHRNGRFRLGKLISHDIPEMHRRLSALTRHYFNLLDADQYGAFLNLLQHHGYPTPLLDWSHSPYVAAFFAFRKVRSRLSLPVGNSANDAVRIFVFDLEAWQQKVDYQITLLNPPFPHVSILRFISLENPRVVPQQAMITSSNLEDIEGYIKSIEDKTGTTFLRAFDIPYTEAPEAMKDLAFMGITAGSIFPGIDGVCEEFKERNFDV